MRSTPGTERYPLPRFSILRKTAGNAYQQNDDLGWINRAKLDETKAKRLQQMLDELEGGDRYMKMLWRTPRGPVAPRSGRPR